MASPFALAECFYRVFEIRSCTWRSNLVECNYTCNPFLKSHHYISFGFDRVGPRAQPRSQAQVVLAYFLLGFFSWVGEKSRSSRTLHVVVLVAATLALLGWVYRLVSNSPAFPFPVGLWFPHTINSFSLPRIPKYPFQSYLLSSHLLSSNTTYLPHLLSTVDMGWRFACTPRETHWYYRFE